MARAEKVGVSDARVAYRGLREWLEQVDRMGELLKINGAHWDKEMGAITHMLTEKSKGNAPAILFAVATLFVIAVLLHYSTVISKLADQNVILAQKLALLERELREKSLC